MAKLLTAMGDEYKRSHVVPNLLMLDSTICDSFTEDMGSSHTKLAKRWVSAIRCVLHILDVDDIKHVSFYRKCFGTSVDAEMSESLIATIMIPCLKAAPGVKDLLADMRRKGATYAQAHETLNETADAIEDLDIQENWPVVVKTLGEAIGAWWRETPLVRKNRKDILEKEIVLKTCSLIDLAKPIWLIRSSTLYAVSFRRPMQRQIVIWCTS